MEKNEETKKKADGIWNGLETNAARITKTHTHVVKRFTHFSPVSIIYPWKSQLKGSPPQLRFPQKDRSRSPRGAYVPSSL